MRAAWLGTLVACGGSPAPIDGSWSGACDTPAAEDRAEEHYDITLELLDDHEELTGTAWVTPDWMFQEFRAAVTGTATADGAVDVSGSFGDVAVNFELSLALTLKGDDLDGTCSTGIADGVASFERTADP